MKFVRKSNSNLQLIISIPEFQQIISQTRTVTRAKINSSIERPRITLHVSPRFVDSLPAVFRKNMGYRSIFNSQHSKQDSSAKSKSLVTFYSAIVLIQARRQICLAYAVLNRSILKFLLKAER